MDGFPKKVNLGGIDDHMYPFNRMLLSLMDDCFRFKKVTSKNGKSEMVVLLVSRKWSFSWRLKWSTSF